VGLGFLQIVLDKGEREDWFESSLIIGFTIISVVALIGLVIRELIVRDPIVDLPLLKDRGFFASNVVMFFIGFILFGSTQIIPQMVQEVMGYTATQAGLVITPGGFVVMALMPIVGFSLSHFQAKYLVAVGLLLEVVALWYMTKLNAQVDYRHVMWARIIQASGLAFLFVPVTTVAYVGIPHDKANNAAALINVSRNIGGSFGISIGQTILAQRAQFHQSRLVEHISPLAPQYPSGFNRLVHTLINAGLSSAEAGKRATGMIYANVGRQSQMLAYIDVFKVMGVIALCVVPLAFMLRRTGDKKGRRSSDSQK
jgi:DHA2 family multidrug resistance protein